MSTGPIPSFDFGALPAILILAGIGVLAMVVALGFGAWWLLSHLAWV